MPRRSPIEQCAWVAVAAVLLAACGSSPPAEEYPARRGASSGSVTHEHWVEDCEGSYDSSLMGIPPDRACATSGPRPMRVAEASPTGPCTEIEIRRPRSVVLHGDQGPIAGTVKTNLPADDYTVTYDRYSDRFDVDPWPRVVPILYISVSEGDIDRYKAYLDGMTGPVPLRVMDGGAAGTPADSLSATDAMQYLAAAGAGSGERAWAQRIAGLGQKKTLTANEVTQALDAHRAGLGITYQKPRSTREAVHALAASWDSLQGWEKQLWHDFVTRYGDKADVMTVRDLRITADVRLSMALRMAPKYMKPGAREAADALFNDPMFLGGTVAGISLYLGLWVIPEPFFTKAAGIMTTISLIAVAGFTATEIIALARAWMRLRDETAKARTLGQLEGAARRFGKKLGGASLRVLLALATAVGSKVLPAGGAAAAPGVAAVSPGGVAIAGVSASGMLVKVQGGVVAIVTGAMAMSAMHGSGSGASGGGTSTPGTGSNAPTASSGPGQWQKVNEGMNERAARYQQQITGRSADEVYVVDSVKFDGYKNGVLIEAKGPGYANKIKDGKFGRWFTGQKGLLKQAERQSRVARKTPIEWHVAEAEVATLLRKMFTNENIPGITVIHTPFKP